MESPFYLDLLTRGAKVGNEWRLRDEKFKNRPHDARPSDLKASQSQTQDTPT